ncbi:rubrerythrin [Nanoarchaeota archaeon]
MEKTLKNLCKAYVGECQARNRYNFYAKIAKKEGYEQVSAIFLETSENERVHAKRLFEHIQELKKKMNLGDDEIEIETSVPNVYGDTIENIKSAIIGEHYESKDMYPEFARIAQEEDLLEIANRFKAIAKAEKHHEERYEKLLEEIEKKSVFKKSEEVEWVCRECGYVYVGKEALEKCPSCDHRQSYYQIRCEKY